MQDIQCPNCGQVIKLDETDYAHLVQQVRDKEFAEELARREKLLESQQQANLALIRSQEQRQREQALSQKEQEILLRERQIAELQAQLRSGETDKKLAVEQAIHAQQQRLAEKNAEITELQARLRSGETDKKLAVEEAIHAQERLLAQKTTELTALQGKLSITEKEAQLRERAITEQYEDKLKLKDEQIEYYKDFKARQSTKMVGESLEQHCLNQFNSLRMTAFPNAYFEKDNDARTGSKGDFIFREADAGTEFISIMFEMKNEMDTTATKHKNEDFLKELDKDRREKGCEYAVLVSLLEIDNEYYNNGIVDVSYKYPKMYVIRPQFFIPIITLLRNAALNSLKYQQELQIVRNQQLDIQHFEENMAAFKEGFSRNYRLASERFQKAIEEIDTTIKHLEKVKDALLSSENNLRLANNKAEDLTIKKLTKNAPTVRELFDNLEKTEG